MTKIDWKTELTRKHRVDHRDRHDETFLSSESGTFTILTISLIAIVFLVAGLGVDMMRFDRERAKLQYALDRAVLAAADLDQDLCPRDVVVDYLDKEGLSQYLVGEVKVTPDVCGSAAATIEGYRKVEASAVMDVDLHFDFVFGYLYGKEDKTLATAATSVAEEAIDDVEISMVLDVSGSMNSNSRLVNLKKAAKNFVQEMADKTEDGKLSISIVPYATQVSLPDYLMNELYTSGENPYANCINFTPDELATSTFEFYNLDSSPIVRPRTLHFTHWYNQDKRPSNQLVNNEICDDRASREVMVLQKDPDVLKTHIENFQAGGNTSIDLGMKWGITLLDQSFRPVIENLAGTNLPAEFDVRPRNYNSGQSMKVIILMTDGANTTQYLVNEPYRDGESMFWWNNAREKYSVYDESRNQYTWYKVDEVEEYPSGSGDYWARIDDWQDYPYGGYNVLQPDGTILVVGNTYSAVRCTSPSNGSCYAYDFSETKEVPVVDDQGDPEVSSHLEWPEVWESTTRYRIYEILRNTLGSTIAYDWYYDAVSSVGSGTKNPSVKALCDIAKANNIIIFSIAFEAPTAGKDILKYCKTDDNSYYEATGDEIVDVFASIGSTIRNLRLTQ